MKIVYVGAFRLPNFDASSQRVLNIGRPLVSLGHEVTYLSWGGKYVDDVVDSEGFHHIEGARYLITGELNFTGLKERVLAKISRGRKSLRLIRELKPDVVITYDTPHSFNEKILKLADELHFKLVADITEWFANNELRFFDVFPNWLNMNRTYRRFKNKIVISSFLDKHFESSHNIVLPPLCSINDEKWKRHAPNSISRSLKLIYAGTPGRKDKVHTVINVVNRLALEGYDIVFNIVGITKEAYLYRYSRLLNTVLTDNVIFHGRVSQDSIPQYYAQSDFMVLLRDNTRKSQAGFPTKFAEAIMSGTPVIANITSDISKYLIDDFNGYIVEDSSEESLYRILKKLCLKLSDERKEELKQNVCQATRQFFDCNEYVSAINKFFDNLK